MTDKRAVSDEQFNELMRGMRTEERRKISINIISSSIVLLAIASILWMVHTGQVVITVTGDANYICDLQEDTDGN